MNGFLLVVLEAGKWRQDACWYTTGAAKFLRRTISWRMLFVARAWGEA
jgi:hypothetical protein